MSEENMNDVAAEETDAPVNEEQKGAGTFTLHGKEYSFDDVSETAGRYVKILTNLQQKRNNLTFEINKLDVLIQSYMDDLSKEVEANDETQTAD